MNQVGQFKVPKSPTKRYLTTCIHQDEWLLVRVEDGREFVVEPRSSAVPVNDARIAIEGQCCESLPKGFGEEKFTGHLEFPPDGQGEGVLTLYQ